jgi:hypothetical protein
LEWLARATNWAKLTATASLGVIHRGHEHEALLLMQSYLPKEVGPSSGYSEGGGLYALGLIHANHGAVITDYLLGQLKDAQNEVSLFSTHFFTRLRSCGMDFINLLANGFMGHLGQHFKNFQ